MNTYRGDPMKTADAHKNRRLLSDAITSALTAERERITKAVEEWRRTLTDENLPLNNVRLDMLDGFQKIIDRTKP